MKHKEHKNHKEHEHEIPKQEDRIRISSDGRCLDELTEEEQETYRKIKGWPSNAQ